MIRNFHCCKDCQKRQIGCHATCEEYITSKQERDRLMAQERQDKQGFIESWEMRKESIEKTKRRNHDRKEKKT